MHTHLDEGEEDEEHGKPGMNVSLWREWIVVSIRDEVSKFCFSTYKSVTSSYLFSPCSTSTLILLS